LHGASTLSFKRFDLRRLGRRLAPRPGEKRSENLRANQRKEQVDEKAQRHDSDNNAFHGSDPVKGIGIANAEGKEADDGQRENEIHHERTLLRFDSVVWEIAISVPADKNPRCEVASLLAKVVPRIAGGGKLQPANGLRRNDSSDAHEGHCNVPEGNCILRDSPVAMRCHCEEGRAVVLERRLTANILHVGNLQGTPCRFHDPRASLPGAVKPAPRRRRFVTRLPFSTYTMTAADFDINGMPLALRCWQLEWLGFVRDHSESQRGERSWRQ
jgi:hypothetical protein